MPAQLLDAAANPNTSFSSSDDRDRDDATHLPSPIAESPRTSISESSNWTRKHTIPQEGEWLTADGIVELLQSYRAGALVGLENGEAEKYTVHLRREEHRRLCHLLGFEGDPPSDEFGSWVHDNVRWDYWPDTQTFSIRMPTPSVLHDVVSQQVINLVYDAAVVAGAGKGALKPVFKLPTLAIQIPGKKQASDAKGRAYTRGSTMRISPDNSIRPANTRYPPFLLEVGFSNPRTERDAIKIINRTKGRISTVLLLNIPYRKPELRRRLPSIEHYTMEVVLVQVVVDEGGWEPRVTHRATLSGDSGTQDGTTKLPLTLQDFYWEKCPEIPVNVTHGELLACLGQAVDEQVFDDNPPASSPQSDTSPSGRLTGIKRKAIDSDIDSGTEEEDEDGSVSTDHVEDEGDSSYDPKSRARPRPRSSVGKRHKMGSN